MRRPNSDMVSRVRASSREGPLESIPDAKWNRLAERAAILRSLGQHSIGRKAAMRAARALHVHWATIYRWRKRLLEADLITALQDRGRGFRGSRLTSAQERVIAQAIAAAQRRGRPAREVDLYEDVRERSSKQSLASPARSSVARRWHHAEAVREGRARDAPGSYHISQPLAVVQVDHTVCDVIVVDDLYRQPIGRPFLTIALDIATRCVLAAMLSFRAPSAATVALCITRIVSKKDEWLHGLGVMADWPMHGVPRSLHLDNAPEFHSKALARGCAQFGIELIYRPLGRPHFGGHVERLIGTLMNRLKSLPGATGASTKERRGRRPEKTAVLTLAECERWLAIEIGQRYHHHEHKGLRGATPHSAWIARAPAPVVPEKLEAFTWTFLPAESRTVRRDGVHFKNIRYWHPLFAQWAVSKSAVLVHYDPRNLSRIYVRQRDQFIEVRYADLRHPAVSLWENEAAARYLRRLGKDSLSESRLFAAIGAQRAIVRNAARDTRRARAEQARRHQRSEPLTKSPESAHDDPQTHPRPPNEHTDYTGEVWD